MAAAPKHRKAETVPLLPELEPGRSLLPSPAHQAVAGYTSLPVVALCALVSVLCSLDRTAMSVAIMPLAARHKWSDSVKGAVGSAFNLGHMATNFYGGYLAATLSPKLVLSAGVVVWSLFTLLTPAACIWLPALLVVRACMGLGEGVAFPCMQAIMKGWVVPEQRTRSLSLIYSGHQIGSILSLLFSPLLIQSTGVESMFYVYGVLGFVWLAAWEPVVASQAPLLSKPPAPLKLSELPWKAFFTNKAFWTLLVCHSTFGILYNTGLVWLPTYYNQEHKLDLKQSSFISVLPWLAMALGTNLSGWIADYLINRKLLSTTKTRKLLQVLGSVGPGLCLLYMGLGPKGGSLHSAVVLLTTTMALLGLQAGGFASNHQDIATKYASVLFGTTNASASLAGSVFVFLVGVILDATHSWPLVFALVAVCCLLSAVFYVACATSEPQFE